MRRVAAVTVVLLASGALGACSSANSPIASPSESEVPRAIQAYAVVGVSSAHSLDTALGCKAWGDAAAVFNDEHLQGTITDASGSIVAVGEFGEAEAFSDGCIRDLVVSVPAGGTFYTLHVGDAASDTYPETELVTGSMTIVLDD